LPVFSRAGEPSEGGDYRQDKTFPGLLPVVSNSMIIAAREIPAKLQWESGFAGIFEPE